MMRTIVTEILRETLQITLLVAVMMIIVDLVNIASKQRLEQFFKNAGRSRQYLLSSLIGTVPGCIGGFTNVSLYIHGLISFGALAGSMIAVSGDEAFVMLVMFPEDALLLFGMLFVIGIISGRGIDRFIHRFRIRTCGNCSEMVVHHHERNIAHYLREHLYGHIIKKHLAKTALWTFFALAFVRFGIDYLHLEHVTSEYRFMMLVISALVGLLPESGPHLIFVTLYAQGAIPFSVLLTSSIVQDGHGMLPMLSYSVRDSMLLKLFNLFIGLMIGSLLFLAGK